MNIFSSRKTSRVMFLILLLGVLHVSKTEEVENNEAEEIIEEEGEKEGKVPYRLCQRDLLYAYGIENPGYIKAPGMLCKHKSPESCCSRTAESQLMEKWIETDRVKLIQNIDGYYHILEGVFDYYEDIILFAKYVHLNPYSNDTCVRAARDLIFNYMKKEEIVLFMTKIKKAFEFLKESRKGFYCSLCDVHYQKFFDTDAKKIIMRTTFCQKLVENTVEAVYQRVNKILPILQNINVLLNCDSESEDGSGGGDTQLEFGIDPDDHLELNHCYNLYTEFNKPELYMVKCLHYCRDYRFSLGSIIFEGSLAKISFLYDKILKKQFAMTDPVFAVKDESRSYIAEDGIENVFYVRREFLFTDVINIYFESRYKTNDFRSFETIFEEEGIEPMVKGQHSKFLFGHEDYIGLLPTNPYASIGAFVLIPVALLKLLF
jgi:hypothetical protein